MSNGGMSYSFIAAMSTFKKPFSYAEVVLKIMDACDTGGLALDLMDKCDWIFPGGAFGAREDADTIPDHPELPTSESVIPGGPMAGWYDEARERRRAGMTGHELYPEAMRTVLRTRRSQYPMSGAVKAMWVANASYMCSDVDAVHFGMKAVYELAYKILQDSSRAENRRVSMKSNAVLTSRELFLGGSASADLSMADCAVIHAFFHEMICKLGIPYLNKAIDALDIAVKMAASCKHNFDDYDVMDLVEKEDALDAENYDFEFRGSITIGPILVAIRPRCLVWKVFGRSWCLGLSDSKKVIILITGTRNYLVGLASDAACAAPTRGNVILMAASDVKKHVTKACDVGRRSPIGSHLALCKGYKTALAVVKARIAGPMSIKYIPGLMDELEGLGLSADAIDAVREFIRDCQALPPSGAMPLAKIFRLMPPPDVWIARALRNRWEKCSVERTIGHAKCEEFKDALREVIMTARMRDKSCKLECREGVSKPAWWPAYLERRFADVPTSELYATCKFENTVALADRNRYNPASWKDSGCSPDTLEEGLSDRRDRRTRNYLLRMVLDGSCPMPDVSRPDAPGEGLCEAGLKGESHKERIFYSNKIASRQHQSVGEETVGRTMAPHPSYAIQKTGVERDDAFNELASPPKPFDMEAQMGCLVALAVLFFSFDISEWSAGMAGDIQMASHQVWDEVTGTNHFTRTANNHVHAVVYCNSDGFKAWYVNGTANFEGYNGKEMTALHIAIMTVAVKRLRKALPDVDPRLLTIVLQAYIDDGMAKLVLPRDIALSIFNVWAEVVVDTWSEFGFKIERKKSFPSPAYFEFLGEEYFAGAHLVSGSKAAMRITAEPFEVYESYADRVTKLASACRGASVAGLPPPGAYLMQSYLVVLETRRWIRIHNPTAVACWILAPRALGGVGMAGHFQQACNASGATTEECMSNLWSWARLNPAVRKAYIGMVRKGMLPRSSRDVLSVPLGGQSRRVMLSSNPIGRHVADRLKELHDEGSLSPLANFMMGLANVEAYDDFAKAVVPLVRGDIYQEALLDDLAAPVPQRIHRAFMGRFESARTITYFVTPAKVRLTVRRNRAEASVSFSAFLSLAGADHRFDEATDVPMVVHRGPNMAILDFDQDR